LLKSCNSFIETLVLDDSGPIKVDGQQSTNGPTATPCRTPNLMWLAADCAENSRETSSSPAARSGQDVEGEADGSVWHDVDAEMVGMNYDGH